MKNPPRLYLIDGSSYIFRAFYGIKQFLSNSKGLPTNAIYGFASMLLKILREEQPEYIAIIFDPKGKTFRHEMYKEYKANRKETPDDLKPQIPYIINLVEVFNIVSMQQEGFEADDLIGTISKKAEKKGFDVTIVSGDKDMMQLISPKIKMLDTMKNKTFGEKEVKEKFGVEPGRVTEVMGLMGDSSDNIPGVPGIGPKTATTLIQNFGDIENLLKNLEQIKKKSLKNKLLEYTEQARLSKKLCTIDTNLNLPVGIEEMKAKKLDSKRIITLFKQLEFAALLSKIELGNEKWVESGKLRGWKSDTDKKKYKLVFSEKELDKIIIQVKNKGLLSIDLETTSVFPMEAEIVGISISIIPHDAYYIPVGHDYPGAPAQLNRDMVLGKLKPVLEDKKIKKIGQNIKYEIIVFQNSGIKIKNIYFDTMIASYLINPSKHNHNLEDIALEYLDYRVITYKEVVGSGSKEVGFNKVDLETAASYSGEDADITLQLSKKLLPALETDALVSLLNNVELPLAEALAEIEINGVKINKNFLKKMSKDLEKDISLSAQKIYDMAGEKFNINSPKQLSELLFEKLKIPPLKKTKTGYSTDMSVLEQLATGYPLPAEIISYRQLSKLKSTYVDALPLLVNSKTGRIHTSFNQTVTATGRLSSSNPNLQNIPIRTDLGRKIRKAFIAEKNHLLLSADYSQIELRILAHLSEDEVLIEAFKKGEDIHVQTGARIFNVFPNMVDSNMRRMAKAVNFGIIYGISPFGLSKNIRVSLKEAKEFIDHYFALYKGVKSYIEQTITDARKNGYVTTILNRRRYLPELNSKNRQMKEFAERTAVNTPVQGSAADLIKIAMINISRAIKSKNLKSKMILQVHDELVFEIPEAEKKMMVDLVNKEMEGVMELKIPLIVDTWIGKNWGEAH
ncbi:MAG TPA: DNA polymerase I [Nitrospinota bacterium]|nr:DNA polymerase I [Nitrospinota bacterium]